MRKCAAVALLITSIVMPVVNAAAPKVSAGTVVPPGFTDVQVACTGASTGIASLPDGTVVVLVQSGSVRLIRADVLLPTPALTMSLAPCNGGERGLLGVAVDPDFKVNGYIYLYFTRPSPSAPGGCVNRASRFTMTGDAIDPNSEIVLVDNISSNAGNHNGWRPGDRRRRVLVHLGRRCRRRPARRFQPERCRPGPQPAQREDPAGRAVDGSILRLATRSADRAPTVVEFVGTHR